MSVTKKIARKFVLPLLIKLKVDRLLLLKTSKNSCIINFHGVRSDETTPINNRHLSLSEFEKTLLYLKKNFEIVKLEELFENFRIKKRSTKKSIALTFDDGYLNNFELALPILKKHNIPATFYIITKGLCEDNYLAWPEIYEIIKEKNPNKLVVNEIEFDNHLYSQKLELYLVDYLKTLGKSTELVAHKIINDNHWLVENSKIPFELLKLIDSKKITQYKNEPLLEFGSHTHSHLCLEYLNDDLCRKELVDSKIVLEKLIDKEIKSLAFPDGSYNKRTLEIAKEVGYTNLVAVNYKYTEKNENKNLLSRFTISNSTTSESNILRLAKEFEVYGI